MFKKHSSKKQIMLHKKFTTAQVNKVNFRKEFFRLSLSEILRIILNLWAKIQKQISQYTENIILLITDISPFSLTTLISKGLIFPDQHNITSCFSRTLWLFNSTLRAHTHSYNNIHNEFSPLLLAVALYDR